MPRGDMREGQSRIARGRASWARGQSVTGMQPDLHLRLEVLDAVEGQQLCSNTLTWICHRIFRRAVQRDIQSVLFACVKPALPHRDEASCASQIFACIEEGVRAVVNKLTPTTAKAREQAAHVS